MPITIEWPPRESQLAFNRQSWAQVVANSALANMPGKIETNRHGQLLMSPPPSGSHSTKQSRILRQLDRLLGGEPLVECPISTVDGVRSADVGWYSKQRFERVADQIAFELAPEICVEVVSPSNTKTELVEKRSLYFEAGAEEVWLCQQEGAIEIFLKDNPATKAKRSSLCPHFPATI